MTDADAAINQRIFDTSIDLILVTDSHGDFVRVSPSCEEVLGYLPEVLVGQNAAAFVYHPDLNAVREAMRRQRRNGFPMRHFDCRYVRHDGIVVTLTWNGVWAEPEGRHIFMGRDMTNGRAVEALEGIQRTLMELDHRISGKWSPALHGVNVNFIGFMLTVDSVWAAIALSVGPPNFVSESGIAIVVETLRDQEAFWAWFVAVAAALKIVALPVRAWTSWRWTGSTVRSVGLAMSGVFWCLMGVGRLEARPDALFAIPAIMLGLSAWWAMLRR